MNFEVHCHIYLNMNNSLNVAMIVPIFSFFVLLSPFKYFNGINIGGQTIQKFFCDDSL
jgi:hypothetical protein